MKTLKYILMMMVCVSLTACMDAKMGLVRMEESRWEHRVPAGSTGSLSYR